MSVRYRKMRPKSQLEAKKGKTKLSREDLKSKFVEDILASPQKTAIVKSLHICGFRSIPVVTESLDSNPEMYGVYCAVQNVAQSLDDKFDMSVQCVYEIGKQISSKRAYSDCLNALGIDNSQSADRVSIQQVVKFTMSCPTILKIFLVIFLITGFLLPNIMLTVDKDLFPKLENFMLSNMALQNTNFPNLVNDLCHVIATDKMPLDTIHMDFLYHSIVFWKMRSTNVLKYTYNYFLFWKAGVCRFGEGLLEFFHGYGNQGQGRGVLDPQKATIVLPVPSKAAVRKFKPTGMDDVHELGFGIYPKAIKLAAKCLPQNSIASIIWDEKEINKGLRKGYGEIDLGGCELGVSLDDIHKKEEDMLSTINSMKVASSQENHTECIHMSHSVMSRQCVLDIGLLEKKDHIVKAQKKKVQSCQSKESEKIEEKKLLNAIGMYHTISDHLVRISKAVDVLLHKLTQKSRFCFKSVSGTSDSGLNDFKQYHPLDVTMMIPQRTALWSEIRNQAPVTGSTLFEIAGLGLKKTRHSHHVKYHKDIPLPPFPDEVMDRLQYGTKNEKNAVLTLATKIIPSLFPQEHLEVVEFGGGFVDGLVTRHGHRDGKCVQLDHEIPTLFVSPDPVIMKVSDDIFKKDLVKMACEIKCPTNGLPHISVPVRYVSQLEAECELLGTEECLFVSWGQSITTAFLYKRDKTFFLKLMAEVDDYISTPRDIKSSSHKEKLLAEAQQLAKRAKLVGIYPSVHESMVNLHSQQGAVWTMTEINIDTDECNDNGEDIADECIGILKTSFNFHKRLATEVCDFLICSSDRYFVDSTQHAMLVAALLTASNVDHAQMVAILNRIYLDAWNANIPVHVWGFDGKWHKFITTALVGTPQTQLQVAKNLLKAARDKSKETLLVELELLLSQNLIMYNGLHFMFHSKGFFMALKGKEAKKPQDNSPEVNNVNTVSCRNTSEESVPKERMETELVSVNVPEPLENSMDVHDVSMSGPERSWDSTVTDHLAMACQESLPGVSVTDQVSTRMTGPESSWDSTRQESLPGFRVTEQVSMDFILNTIDIQQLRTYFQSDPRSKLQKLSDFDLNDLFQNAENLYHNATSLDLKNILKWVRDKLHQSFKVSGLNKKEMVNCIFTHLNIPSHKEIIIPSHSKPSHKKNVPKDKSWIKIKSLSMATVTLKDFACQAVRKLPKDALVYAICNYHASEVMQVWRDNGTVSFELDIPEIGKPDWFFQPQIHPNTKQLLFCLEDYHHLHIRWRAATVKNQIDGINVDHFKKAAECGMLRLKPKMLEVQYFNGKPKLLNHQSEEYARILFDSDVERELNKLGYDDEATFCRLVREWNEANDSRGFSAFERIKRRHAFRSFLMNGVTLTKFPCPTANIKGIPIDLFESTVSSIDAHTLLYGIIDMYNPRSFSTNENELLHSCITDMTNSTDGTPDSFELRNILSRVLMLMNMKLDPANPFPIKTTATRVYDLQKHDTSHDTVQYMPTSYIDQLIINDHSFDRYQSDGRKPRGFHEWWQPATGAKGPRYHHRLREADLTTADRLGIPV